MRWWRVCSNKRWLCMKPMIEVLGIAIFGVCSRFVVRVEILQGMPKRKS